MSDSDKVLQFKNQKLREQLELQKREKAGLEEKVNGLQQKQCRYEDNLRCVNRLWGELNRDIAVLASRARTSQIKVEDGDTEVGRVKQDDGAHVKDEDGTDTKALASAKDPFLLRLIKGNNWAEKKCEELQADDGWSDMSDVEKSLVSKCDTTKSALCGVLDAIDSARRAPVPDAESSGDGDSSGELNRLRKENGALQQELDGLRGVDMAAESRYFALQDDLLKAEKEVKDLSNELADKQEDVVILQRKLMVARNKAEQEGRSNAAASTSAAGQNDIKTPQRTGSGSVGGDVDGSTQLQLAEMRRRLEKRTNELEEERKMSRQLRLELREAKLSLQDETRYLQTKMHQEMLNRLNLLNAEFARHRDMTANMRREMDMMALRDGEFSLKVADAEKAERMYHILEARARDLEIQKVSAAKSRDEAQTKLQAMGEKIGQADTVQQLKVMVATLQKEISLLQRNNTKLKGSQTQLDEALAQAESSKTAWLKVEAEKNAIATKLKAASIKEEGLEGEKQELKDKAEDLRVFVEVLQSVQDISDGVAEAQARAKRAEEVGADLRRQLEASKLMKGKEHAEAELGKLKLELEKISQEKDGIQIECDSLLRQRKELKENVENQKAEVEAYIQEIDVIGSAYEEMQAQNTTLLQQITERDAVTHKLQSERLQLDQRANNLLEEKAMFQSKITAAESKAEVLQARENELQSQINRLKDDITQGRKKLTETSLQLEEANRTIRARDEALSDKQAVVDACQRHRDETMRAAKETGDKLEAERVKRQSLEEEVRIVNSRVERLKRREDSSVANKELEGELEDMRTLLRCSVCHERQKNVIITKCFHMFCKECIQRNLDSRHRKCPGCGTAFGSADVKSCFFT